MNDLSIIIPWRDAKDSFRKANFNYIKWRLEKIFPKADIIISDNDDDSFSRSKAINKGVHLSNNELLIISDADTVVHSKAMWQGLEMIEKSKDGWVIPYGIPKYFSLTQKASILITSIIDIDIDDSKFKDKDYDVHPLLSWSGVAILRKSNFLKVKGFDENFVGWGYEDNAFQAAMDTMCGRHKRIDWACAYHLWHPIHTHNTWEQPNILKNRLLYEEYRQAENDKEAMGRLISKR